MRDKIKSLIFIISMAYSIVIIVLMLYSYSTSINTIEFNDNEDNIKLLNNYKEKLANIEASTCKNSINELINHYEKTSFNGNVNLKEKYLGEVEIGIIKYAPSIIKECNLSDTDRSTMALKMLTSSIQFDEVIETLKFQYEIRIPDLNNRSMMETSLNPIRYNINRKNQLDIIEMLIDNLKEE